MRPSYIFAWSEKLVGRWCDCCCCCCWLDESAGWERDRRGWRTVIWTNAGPSAPLFPGAFSSSSSQSAVGWEGWNVLFACVSSRKKGRCPPLTCTSFLSFFLLLASSRPTTQTAQVCVCVNQRHLRSSSRITQMRIAVVDLLLRRNYLPPDRLSHLIFSPAKKGRGARVNQTISSLCPIAPATNTDTDCWRKSRTTTKVSGQEREGGGIKLLLQLIICQRLVATTAAVWFSVLVVSNDQIIIIKKMGLGEREKTRKEFQGSISVCVLRWTISPAGLVNCFIEFRCGGGGGPIDDIWYRR